MKTILELDNISVSYDAVDALKNVSIKIENGNIVTLLGANGAGKTTLLKAISRLVPLKNGSIIYKNENITSLSPDLVVKKGIAHSPEGRRIFPDLTVMENLQLGAYVLKENSEIKKNIERSFHYFPVLADRRNQKGGTLSGGEQQMLAVGRALMSSPELLLLDEPSLGLAPKIIDQIFDIIKRINREENVTVFLIEQNANEALLHADLAYVIENGRIILDFDNNPEKLRKDPRIIDAYLGRQCSVT